MRSFSILFASAAAAEQLSSDAILDVADRFLVAHRDLIGVADPLRDLQPAPPETDARGHSRVRYRQWHQGVPVLYGEVTVHLCGESVHTLERRERQDRVLAICAREPESRTFPGRIIVLN